MSRRKSTWTCAGSGRPCSSAATPAQAPVAQARQDTAALWKTWSNVCTSLTVDFGSVGIMLNRNRGVGENIWIMSFDCLGFAAYGFEVIFEEVANHPAKKSAIGPG